MKHKYQRQKYPEKNEPLDLVTLFEAENINIKQIKTARRSRKQSNLGLAPYTGEWGKKQQRHLLNRTLVGLCPRHWEDIEGKSLTETLDLLFAEEPDLGQPINDYFLRMDAAAYKARYESDDVGPGEPFIERAYKDFEQFGGERWDAVKSWVYKRIYNQYTSIHWKLFLFLHQLVPTGSFDMGHKGLYNYIKLLFESCFGSYKQFIYDITLDPSMLEYLSLQHSLKETPDENYAREVQELFTVGKRPFAQFSEKDVREIARALVGWYYNYDELVFDAGADTAVYFNPDNHDTGDKEFSAFYNNTQIKGKTGEAGAHELAEVVDMLFATEESCIYICRRLYQFFVYPELSDFIEESIIKPMAQIMRDNNFSLIAPLKVLLQSEHFFDATLFNSVIKPPVEFFFGAIKDVDVFNGELVKYAEQEGEETIYASNNTSGYTFPEKFTNLQSRWHYLTSGINWRTNNIGLEITNPPNVSGWPAFYQEPAYDLLWINSLTIKNRKNGTQDIVSWGLWLDHYLHIILDLFNYLSSFSTPENLDAFIDELDERLLGGTLNANSRERLRKNVLNDLNPSYWQTAVSRFMQNPTIENRQAFQWKFDALMREIYQLPEIHTF